jgi:hypothetical protein
MRLTNLWCLGAGFLFTAGSLPAQGHAAHRHPAGAKILIRGTLVEAACYFAERQRSSALTQCARERSSHDFHAALIDSDSTFYLLALRSTPDILASLTPLMGREVKVDGTVFPAATAYVIVLDSLRAANP